jgi:hypothetical protein
MAVVVASLPAILPKDLVPDFIEGSLVMWITTAGTAVMAIQSDYHPPRQKAPLCVRLAQSTFSIFVLPGMVFRFVV